jgi:hypothetical protein
MKLPMPGVEYDRTKQIELVRQVELADKANHKRNQDVEVGQGRLILTSPDGTRWSIEVSNAGTISATSL